MQIKYEYYISENEYIYSHTHIQVGDIIAIEIYMNVWVPPLFRSAWPWMIIG